VSNKGSVKVAESGYITMAPPISDAVLSRNWDPSIMAVNPKRDTAVPMDA